MDPVCTTAILNENADSIRLSNPRKGQEIGSPINGSRLFEGTIWDSQIGEIRAGIDYHDPSKAIITIRHNDIPANVVDYDRHHWGFMGVYEIPTTWIHKKKGIFSKYDFCERSVLLYVSKIFIDWKNMVKAGGIVTDIPISLDGENTNYSDTLPDPSIVIDNLPLEHHKDQGSQNFTYIPQAVFVVKRYKEISLWGQDKSTTTETLECLRVDIQTHGWWQAEDGSWHDTSFTTSKYATRTFIDRARGNYQRVLERDKAEVAKDTVDVEPAFDESLGRIFT